MGAYSVIFLFNRDGSKVLLDRHKKTSYIGRLNGVGGKLEKGEPALICAVRETAEETGVVIDPMDMMWIADLHIPIDCAFPETGECVLHYYSAIVDEDAVKYDTGEALQWMDSDEVMHALIQDERFAGEGDVQYIVHQAYIRHGFKSRNTDLSYNIEMGKDGDDFIFAENLSEQAARDKKIEVAGSLTDGAYVKLVPTATKGGIFDSVSGAAFRNLLKNFNPMNGAVLRNLFKKEESV